MTTPQPLFFVRDLGRMSYTQALELQRQLNDAVCAQTQPPTLLLVEHEPVITVTPRKSAAMNLLASPDRLARLGIEVCETDRGGDITYHGPGQLVAYPIFRLVPWGLNLSRYMRLLEQVVIDTLAAFGVTAHREAGATGVWVDLQPVTTTADDKPARRTSASSAKICAMGVRIRRHVTMHGLALNVTTDLTHFQTIVPCGLAGRAVTNLQQLLGECCPTMDEVKTQLIHAMTRAVAQCAQQLSAPAE
jgi:lipoate-protein ligase B